MNTTILRPAFSENDILGAVDVNAIVSHAGDARKRHNSKLHSWGIVHGLVVSGEEREGSNGKYFEVKLSSGMAIDGNGREIVVSRDIRLSEDSFDQLNVVEGNNDLEQHYYPVLLVGRDREKSASPTSVSICTSGSPARIEEGYEITFGRIGSSTGLDTQKTIDPGTGSSIGSPNGWRILLGFVTWDGGHFAGVADSADGSSRRYAGVRGEEVIGLGDSLTLRSAERTESDKAALVVDNENGGEMRFGLHNGKGAVVPVFTVNAQGDVIAEGKILGAIAGGVQIESGVITDGIEVPLPAGITQEQVDQGEASIQITVQPRYQLPASLPSPAANEFWLMQPIDCYVDDRRVVCLVLWITTDGLQRKLLPGVCDYVVRGFVKQEDS